MTAALLEVRDLEIAFPAGSGWVPVVRGAAFDVRRGEIVGLVGESGSGKTLTALALLGLVPPPGRVTPAARASRPRRPQRPGDANHAVDLLRLDARGLRAVRGAGIGLVFQEPATALNPVYTIGFQIAEAVRAAPALPRRGRPGRRPRAARPGGAGRRRGGGSTTTRTSSPAASASGR